MHRQLISGHLAWPTPRDARVQRIGKLRTRPRDHASFPQVAREAGGSGTRKVLQPTHSRSGFATRPQSATRHLPGMSDDSVRPRMTHGHVKMHMPTACETALEDTVAMAGRMARFAVPARLVLETA